MISTCAKVGSIQPVAAARHPGIEFVVTERPRRAERVYASFERLAEQLAAGGAEIVHLMIYGEPTVRREIAAAMRAVLGDTQWPVTWIESPTGIDGAFGGLQAFAVGGAEVKRVRLGQRVVGSVYEDAGARHCHLGGIGPTSLALQPAAQVQQTFGNLEWALDMAGFALGDVVRTWFYNEDILTWYPEFNRVRSAHYGGVRWRTGSLPASTGIGARNPGESALTVAAWAMRPLDLLVRAREIPSPLQCPAPAYGSSFSRAMEINSGDWRRLLISGTASIHPDGRTAYEGDARQQVELTMDVIAAILQSRQLTFNDVTRATAYFQHPMFKPYFDAWCASHGLGRMPVVSTHCDVCRADLLFELELDAARGTPLQLTTDNVRTKSAQQSPTSA
jgi:enamine deaminase RidA (YjgF/YER057c/UK114 family)